MFLVNLIPSSINIFLNFDYVVGQIIKHYSFKGMFVKPFELQIYILFKGCHKIWNQGIMGEWFQLKNEKVIWV